MTNDQVQSEETSMTPDAAMQTDTVAERPKISDAVASGAGLALAGAAIVAMSMAVYGSNEGAAFIASILWPTAFVAKCAEALLLRKRLGEL